MTSVASVASARVVKKNGAVSIVGKKRKDGFCYTRRSDTGDTGPLNTPAAAGQMRS
jgi:hypothetical protein